MSLFEVGKSLYDVLMLERAVSYADVGQSFSHMSPLITYEHLQWPDVEESHWTMLVACYVTKLVYALHKVAYVTVSLLYQDI